MTDVQDTTQGAGAERAARLVLLMDDERFLTRALGQRVRRAGYDVATDLTARANIRCVLDKPFGARHVVAKIRELIGPPGGYGITAAASLAAPYVITG